MATEVLGLYDTREAAQQAAQALEQEGYSHSDIRIEAYDGSAGTGTGGGQPESGWSKVMEKLHLMAPKRDTDYYSQGVRHGQTLVSVTTADEAADRAADILDGFGALDIEANAAQYHAGLGSTADAQYGTPAAGRTAGTGEGAVIPVIEEELQVGKRAVQRGGVRIYQHVTERPVQESVTLREENVTVDRHPVDRAVTDADAAFQERSYELTETAEVPVVAKGSRVVEEVSIGKTATERTETVHDTVRRTDVEVEKIDGDTHSVTR